MKSFVWTEQYETGIATVDGQHRFLVDLVNEFGDRFVGSGVNREDVGAFVRELREYSEYHFREEEQLMLDVGLLDEEVEDHRKAHAHFTAEVEIAEESLGGLPDAGVSHLYDYLVYWLGYHILGIDQRMARQIEMIHGGATPEEAASHERERDEGAVQPLLASIVGLLHVLQSTNQKMREINHELEVRVKERTAELERAHAVMRDMAMHDALTGLANRRRAIDFLEEHWVSGAPRPLCCAMIDADHFKTVNDSFGHEAGDEVLRRLARLIAANFRSDDLTARLGGDEFIVLCPNTALKDALVLAQRLWQSVQELSVPTGTGNWQGSLSIGVAVRDPQMTEPVELLQAADRSVYAAKEAGRNTVCSLQSSTAAQEDRATRRPRADSARRG